MRLLKPLIALGVAAAAYVGVEKFKSAAASKAQWPLKAGEAYAVHLRYNGAGVGGAPSTQQVLAVLNANAAGALSLANTPTVDPTNKVISFLIVPVSAYTLPASVLTTGWPAPYGTVSTFAGSVQDVGANPLTAAA